MSNNSATPGGNPFLGGRPIRPRSSTRTAEPSPRWIWLSVALSVLLNLAGLIGVAKFGWPAGNVLALCWIENVILGFWSLVRVATARGTETTGSNVVKTRSGRMPTSTVGLALFFCFHYGIFCLVHGVFTAAVAYQIGFELSVAWLALPALLIMIRYAAETTTTWFGDRGQRHRLSAQGAMMLPYPRIIVLHVVLIVSFWVTMDADGPSGIFGKVRDLLQPVEEMLPLPSLDDGVRVILILILVKTIVDIKTTWTALHR